MDSRSGFHRGNFPGFVAGILVGGSIQVTSMIPMPYRMLAILLLLLGGITFGFIEGISRESDRRDAQDLQKERDTAKARAALQVKADNESKRREGIGAQRETTREQIRVVYRSIKEKADEAVKNHPEFNDCSLDADSLRNWNSANAGSAAASPVSGESHLALPDTAAGQVGQPGGSVSEPHRGDGAGSAVSGSDGKAGGMPKSGVIPHG